MASSKECEGFEIAIEMRLHGVPALDRDAELDRHLEGCAACGAYEVQARQVDAALTAPMTPDWEALRRRVRTSRYASLAGALLCAALFAWLTVKSWLERLGRSSSALPSATYLPLDVLFGAVFGAWVVWRAWKRALEARDADSPEYLRRLYHEDLVTRIRSARLPTILLLPVLVWGLVHPAGGVSSWLNALLILLVLWERFVNLPRLEREEQDLPFFDDFPHVV